MKIIAYTYSDRLIEDPPTKDIWGWEIDRVYVDLGDRLEWQNLIYDSQVEPVDYLLIRRLEELGETLTEVSERIQQINSLKMQIIATETDINGQIQLLEILANLADNQQSTKLRQGHAKNRLANLPPPGKAPYGYRRSKDKYVIDRSTYPVVKDFFDRFIIYGSLRGTVRYLEQKYGKKISVSTGKRWLTNPVYRGNTAYKDGVIISHTHQAILAPDEAAQIDRLLRRNRQLPPRTVSAPRSLAGLVFCANCGESMLVSSTSFVRKKEKYLYLRPNKCPQKTPCKLIPYQEFLTEVINQICRDLPRAVSQLDFAQRPNVKDLMFGKIEEKQNIIKQLDDLVNEGILDQQTAQLRAYKLKAEISEMEKKISALPPINLSTLSQTISLPQFWLDLSESERRFYFREFIKAIKVDRLRDRLVEGEWQIIIEFVF